MSAPAVAVSADGKKFAAAWKDVRADEPNVYWAFADRPAFARDDLLHAETKGEQNHPSIAFDATGTLWTAWLDKRPDRRRIWVRSSTDGDTGREITEASESTVSFPVIACNAGLVGVAYEARKGDKSIAVFRVVRSEKR